MSSSLRASLASVAPWTESLLTSAEFLTRLVAGLTSHISYTERAFPLSNLTPAAAAAAADAGPLRVFPPPPSYASRARGTAILIHGLAPTGYDDPRMQQLAAAAAAVGFVAVVPHVPALQRGEIVEGIEDYLAAVFVALAHPGSDYPAPFVIIGACISIGMAVVAAARPEIAAASARIHRLLAFGIHSRVDTCFVHAYAPYMKENYARNSLTFNFLPLLHDLVIPDGLLPILHTAWAENHLRVDPADRTASKLPALMDEFPAAADFYRKLEGDVDFRRDIGDRILRAYAEVGERMSPGVAGVEGTPLEVVALVHGAQDDIVPPEQSVELCDLFRAKGGVETSLCVTPLLNHADQGPLTPWAVLRLMLAMRPVFRWDV